MKFNFFLIIKFCSGQPSIKNLKKKITKLIKPIFNTLYHFKRNLSLIPDMYQYLFTVY